MKRLIIFLAVMAALLWAGQAMADGAKAKEFLKNVQWLGHDTFRITAGKVIYIDPFRLRDRDATPKADIILVTHDHYDHCSPEDVKKLVKPDTIVITTSPCSVRLRSVAKALVMQRGQTMGLDEIQVDAVPAYNIGKSYHPLYGDGVGYILTIKGQRLYFAGDTDHIPEMKQLKDINIAFLPVSGKVVMTAEEAAKAALEIKPDIAVPMHYGRDIGTRVDAELFAEKLRGKIEVVIMKEE